MSVGIAREEGMTGTTGVRSSLEDRYDKFLREDLSFRGQVSYVGNKKEPVLRWFRFKEAFSGELVRRLLSKFESSHDNCVLDPFCGMGTTPFVCQQHGIPSVGVDNFQIATFIASTIVSAHEVDLEDVKRWAVKLPELASEQVPNAIPDVPTIKVAFQPDVLQELLRWREAIFCIDNSTVRNIIALAFFNVIQDVSYTSNDGQFLRLVKNKRIPRVEKAFKKHIKVVLEDLARKEFWAPKKKLSVIIEGDSRKLSKLELPAVDTVITSPPYLNRYDYSRSYVLQFVIYFLKSANDIKEVRFRRLLRSHIESKVSKGEKPNHPAVTEVLDCLKKKRLNNPRIPCMILAYFRDMEECIKELSKVLNKKAKVAFVIGNTRFEGEVIPVDLILSDIAQRYGFEVKEIIVTRYKGNSSQQMKRYGMFRVRESILFWEFTG